MISAITTGIEPRIALAAQLQLGTGGPESNLSWHIWITVPGLASVLLAVLEVDLT
jgi:hypothetical protein